MSATTEKSGAKAIRLFHVDVPDEALVDLRRRIAATRWPDKETVDDGSQGTPLAKIQDLVHYWGTDYDWRRFETKLNACRSSSRTSTGSTSTSSTFVRPSPARCL